MHYDHSLQKVFGISIDFFDDDFNLVKRLDAKEGIFEKGIDKWHVFDIMEQRLNNRETSVTFYHKKILKLGLVPDEIVRVVKNPEEMSLLELFSYMKKIEKEGYDATSYIVDFHAKIAFPFMCVIMSIVGVGICVKRKRNDNIAIAIALGIGVAFLYWVFYSFCLSLGSGGILPPLIAVWTPNLIFICVGVAMLLTPELS